VIQLRAGITDLPHLESLIDFVGICARPETSDLIAADFRKPETAVESKRDAEGRAIRGREGKLGDDTRGQAGRNQLWVAGDQSQSQQAIRGCDAHFTRQTEGHRSYGRAWSRSLVAQRQLPTGAVPPGLTHHDRQVLRLEKARPLLEQIKAAIVAARIDALPKSPLAKACNV
jgi:hypothetical protein